MTRGRTTGAIRREVECAARNGNARSEPFRRTFLLGVRFVITVWLSDVPFVRNKIKKNPTISDREAANWKHEIFPYNAERRWRSPRAYGVRQKDETILHGGRVSFSRSLGRGDRAIR